MTAYMQAMVMTSIGGPEARSIRRQGWARAGHAAAIYYSLVESCKANKVNPLTYLTAWACNDC
jgi:hypothetical protein